MVSSSPILSVCGFVMVIVHAFGFPVFTRLTGMYFSVYENKICEWFVGLIIIICLEYEFIIWFCCNRRSFWCRWKWTSANRILCKRKGCLPCVRNNGPCCVCIDVLLGIPSYCFDAFNFQLLEKLFRISFLPKSENSRSQIRHRKMDKNAAWSIQQILSTTNFHCVSASFSMESFVLAFRLLQLCTTTFGWVDWRQQYSCYKLFCFSLRSRR